MPNVDARIIIIGVIIGLVLLYNVVEVLDARRAEKDRTKPDDEEEEQ